MVNQLIADTSFSRGAELTTMSRPTGVISAPPRPWTVRKRTSCASDCEKPHSTEPARNTTMAVMKTRRGP